MTHQKPGWLILLLVGAMLTGEAEAQFSRRFVPKPGETLVFVGGDPAAIGGTERFRDGFVNNVDVPAGVSQPLSLDAPPEEAEASIRPFLDSLLLDRCAIHLDLRIPAAEGAEQKIAPLVSLIQSCPEHPFLIELSYGAGDDAAVFQQNFRGVVKAFADAGAANVTFVLGCRENPGLGEADRFDPGRDYYSWTACRWDGTESLDGVLEFTRRAGKSCLVQLVLPRDRVPLDALWPKHLQPFFETVEKHRPLIGAISYPARESELLNASDALLKNWRERMNDPGYVTSPDKPFDHIGFPAPLGEGRLRDPGEAEKYRNPGLTIRERLDDLIHRMSPEQKRAQLKGWLIRDNSEFIRDGRIFGKELYAAQLPLGIGLVGGPYLNREDDIRQTLAAQDYLLRETKPAIPAIFFARASHGVMKMDATAFPVPAALACCWNPALVEKIYDHIGREARSRGVSLVLGPSLNLARDPRWGGMDETLGEDAFLASRIGAAMVRGLQGPEPGSLASSHVAAAPFHFAGSGAGLGGKSRAAVALGPRQLLDNEIEVFRHVIASSRPAGVVLAYNEIDGIPCHHNRWLIRDVLRGELKFDGLVISEEDWLNFALEDQQTGRNAGEVAAMAARAGLEADLAGGDEAGTDIAIPAETIDRAVRSVLELKFKLGLFENPPPNVQLAASLVRGEEARELAREAARQSLVLLKNDGLLPLNRSSLKKLAVIGPNAAVCRTGSASGTPEAPVSLLDGIRKAAGDGVEVVHAEGCIFALNDTHNCYQNWRHVSHVNFAGMEINQPLIDQAAALAAECDAVILALGENMFIGRESRSPSHIGDRSALALTREQEELARRILAAGKPVVLYLAHGRPIALGDLEPGFKAVLTGHYNGQETGTAAAEVIFGDRNPSGKLAVTWPGSTGTLPSHYGKNHGSGVFPYIGRDDVPLYPFGHGLSYTQFEYSAPALSEASLKEGGKVTATFSVSNTGSRQGAEIAQLYVSGGGFEVIRPELELKGFARVELAPGEKKEVRIELSSDDLAFHDAGMRRSLLAGEYRIRVGGSSVALGPSVTLVITENSLPGTEEKPKAPPQPAPEVKPRPPVEMTSVRLPEPKETIPPPPVAPVMATKPNVLFICVDDLRPGFEEISPRIDSLARSGLRLENAYCQEPGSGASRLSVMTGKYPFALGLDSSGDIRHWRSRLAGVATLHQAFDAAGYETIGLGKLYGDAPDDNARGEWDRWIAIEAAPAGNGPREIPDDSFLDWKRAGEAARVLEELAAGPKKPFFLGVGLSLPKRGSDIPLTYLNRFPAEKVSLPGVVTLPDGYPEIAPASVITPEEGIERVRAYSAAVGYLDDCVGRILDHLEAAGLRENTIIALWSDSGVKLGDHGAWDDGTLLECDNRATLAIADPRLETARGQSSRSLVELVDLFPTLCDLAGVKPPESLQGRSFRPLFTNPGHPHRESSYSSLPSSGGHSIRFQSFRYTEWFDPAGKLTHRVLTDLENDPGERASVAMLPASAKNLKTARSLLYQRIREITGQELKEPETEPGELPHVRLTLDLSPPNIRQTIDGFGGSIFSLAERADDDALQAALSGLNASLLRVPGEVSDQGEVDASRDILERARKINPGLRVILAFSQPRSLKALAPDYWIDPPGHALRPEREDEWANEILFRVRQFVNWGSSVAAVCVKNSAPHETVSCQWDPERLALFIENRLRPRFLASGLASIRIAAPDLLHPGDQGDELDRFIPVLTSPAVQPVTFQMHDAAIPGAEETGIPRIEKLNSALAAFRTQHFPDKQLWMTETEGLAGSGPGAPDPAVGAARCIHAALVNGEASAFLWKHLLQAAGDGPETGLILLESELDNGRRKFRGRSRAYFAFRQYSAFIEPGCRRVEVAAPDHVHVSAFLSPGEEKVALVAINDNAGPVQITVTPPQGMKLIGSFQTDETRNCSPVEDSRLAPKSIRTLIFSK